MGKVSNSVRPHRLVHLSKTKFNSTKKAAFAHFPNTFILKRLFCIVLLTTVYYVINKMMNLFLDIQFKSSVTNKCNRHKILYIYYCHYFTLFGQDCIWQHCQIWHVTKQTVTCLPRQDFADSRKDMALMQKVVVLWPEFYAPTCDCNLL